jgi:putative flippase GtrA
VIRHFLSAQFLRFLFVGATAALMNWLARYWLSNWLTFPVAVAFAYIIGIAVAFELNRRFVFPTSNRPLVRQARDFILVNAAFFPVVWLAALLFKNLLQHFGVSVFVEGIAHGLAIALPMLMTFLIYKFIAFGSK